MKEIKIKKRILIIALVLLAYPLVEYLTPIKMFGKVARADLVSKFEPFTASNWFDGKFQDSFMLYMNDQIGLFPFFLKVHNQIEYSLFGNIYTGNVVKGKDNYLFEQEYIDVHFGKDFTGLERIEENTTKFKALQDSLSARGKFLMYCIATVKPIYYPEYLPYVEEVDSTNYQYYTENFDKNGVNYIDCNPWFLQMKDTMGHLLFPQFGIHWSHYSSVMVTDSIVKYIEGNTGWDLPNLTITERNYSSTAKYYDNDIAHSLHLFNEIQPEPMIYPEFEWDSPKKEKRNVLIVGDSFTWDIFKYNGLGTECFENIQFWYYNQTVHIEAEKDLKADSGLPILTRHMDLNDIINDYDAFIILSSVPNLANLSWGFLDDALLTIADSTYVREERNNLYLEKQSKDRRDWREDMQDLADDRGISVDSMRTIFLHDTNFKPR